MAAKRKGKQKRKSSWRFHLLGLLGLGCVAWSAAGLWGTRQGAPLSHSEEDAPPAPIQHQTPEGRQDLLNRVSGWAQVLTLMKFYLEHGVQY